MIPKGFVLVPEKFVKGDIEIIEALTWCTDKVVALDAENQRLRQKINDYEEQERLQVPIEVIQSRGTA